MLAAGCALLLLSLGTGCKQGYGDYCERHSDCSSNFCNINTSEPQRSFCCNPLVPSTCSRQTVDASISFDSGPIDLATSADTATPQDADVGVGTDGANDAAPDLATSSSDASDATATDSGSD